MQCVVCVRVAAGGVYEERILTVAQLAEICELPSLHTLRLQLLSILDAQLSLALTPQLAADTLHALHSPAIELLQLCELREQTLRQTTLLNSNTTNTANTMNTLHTTDTANTALNTPKTSP